MITKQKAYNRTYNGFIGKRYDYMQQRIKGKSKNPEKYLGLEICTREEFRKWATDNETLKTLYDTWVKANYSKPLTPSVNRKDVTKGYILDNIEWVTYSQNCNYRMVIDYD